MASINIWFHAYFSIWQILALGKCLVSLIPLGTSEIARQSRWVNWVPERLSDLSEVIRLLHGRSWKGCSIFLGLFLSLGKENWGRGNWGNHSFLLVLQHEPMIPLPTSVPSGNVKSHAPSPGEVLDPFQPGVASRRCHHLLSVLYPLSSTWDKSFRSCSVPSTLAETLGKQEAPFSIWPNDTFLLWYWKEPTLPRSMEVEVQRNVTQMLISETH